MNQKEAGIGPFKKKNSKVYFRHHNNTFWCLELKNKFDPCSIVYIFKQLQNPSDLHLIDRLQNACLLKFLMLVDRPTIWNVSKLQSLNFLLDFLSD